MKHKWMVRRKKDKKNPRVEEQEKKDLESYKNAELFSELEQNLDQIRLTLGNSSDLVIRLFSMGTRSGAVVFTDGLANTELITNSLIASLIDENNQKKLEGISDADLYINNIQTKIINIVEVDHVRNWKDFYLSILSGRTVVIIDGINIGISADTKGWDERGVEEPTTSTVIRGPKEGFTESIRTNTALIRRRIKSPKLWLEERRIGEVSQTDVGIMYMKGIADEEIVKEVRTRLDRINTDLILETGYIEAFIQDEVYTPFPTVFHTERPDIIVANLMEGRIAILVDGTPFVLVVPAAFITFFQSPEDYYQRYDFGSFVRLLRYLAFFIALLTPSLYVALTTFHQEMLPTPLLISLAAQREGVPFPAIIEALLMEIVFEILREAGLRMPKAIGNAISIVGALVIGDAAVNAGLVSPAIVIVVALTAISSFVAPSFSIGLSIRLLRFVVIIMAGMFGLYGVTMFLLLLLLHLCSLRSFGVPYLKSIAPFYLQDQKDVFVRFPLWLMKWRPKLIAQNNMRRVGVNQGPQKPPESQIFNRQSGEESGNE